MNQVLENRRTIEKEKEVIALKEEFDAVVTSILEKKSSESYSFINFLNRTLWQFKLGSTYSAPDIFSEAYVRGIRKIEEGVEIKIPAAWLRATCYNIIREFSREEKRKRLSREHILTEPQEIDKTAVEMMEPHLHSVWYAFKAISDEDKRLLLLRIVDNMSWQEISEVLSKDFPYTKKTTSSLRTAGSRALRRLRRKYHEITEML